MTFNTNTLAYMVFDAVVLVIISVCVYLKLIPNDILLVALGAIVMHGFGIIPTSTALATNTAALKENTTATIASVLPAPAQLPVAEVASALANATKVAG